MTNIGQLTEGQRLSTAELLKLVEKSQVELGWFESNRRGEGRVELLLGDGRRVTVTVTDSS
jgi:hypothetical protein